MNGTDNTEQKKKQDVLKINGVRLQQSSLLPPMNLTKENPS